MATPPPMMASHHAKKAAHRRKATAPTGEERKPAKMPIDTERTTPRDDIAAAGRTAYALITAGKMTLKAARSHPLYIKGSPRNKKLKPNSREKWYIYNLPAVITCPNSTPACRALCYALKAEKQYKTARDRRAMNFIESRRADFAERLIYTLYVEKAAAERRGARLNVRIHESGDFYGREYVEKWLTAATEFAGDPSVAFWAYTKSFDFFHTPDECRALNVRASVWADTPAADLERIAALELPIYTAYTAEEIARRLASGERWHVCRCADCANCRACNCPKVARIVCEIH